MNIFEKITDKVTGRPIIYKNPTPIYHDSLPFVLLWSAKSGCSSMTKWFFTHLGILEEAYAYNKWIHHYRKDIFQKTPDYNKKLLKKLKQSDTHVVKLVRSPYSRAVSSYLAIQSKYSNNRNFDKFQNRDRKRILEFLGRGEHLENPFSFREFVDFLKNGTYTNIHFITQTHPSEIQNKITVDQIIHLENLQAELINLEKKFNLKPIDQEILFKSNHHASYKNTDNEFCGDTLFPYERSKDFKIPQYQNFYDQALQEKVYEVYQEDFTRYGYDKAL